jgi:hypothetical protein
MMAGKDRGVRLSTSRAALERLAEINAASARGNALPGHAVERRGLA